MTADGEYIKRRLMNDFDQILIKIKDSVTYLWSYFEWPKNIFASTESLKSWFNFVDSNPITTQKLVLVIFDCRWPRSKWIETWKN